MSLFGTEEKNYCENIIQYLNFDAKIEKSSFNKRVFDIYAVLPSSSFENARRVIRLSVRFDKDETNPPIDVSYHPQCKFTLFQCKNLQSYLESQTNYKYDVQEFGLIGCDDLDIDQAVEVANYFYENGEDILNYKDCGAKSVADAVGGNVRNAAELHALVQEWCDEYDRQMKENPLKYDYEGIIAGYITSHVKADDVLISRGPNFVKLNFNGFLYMYNWVNGEDVENNKGYFIRYARKVWEKEFDRFSTFLTQRMRRYSYFQEPVIESVLHCYIQNHYEELRLFTFPDLFDEHNRVK